MSMSSWRVYKCDRCGTEQDEAFENVVQFPIPKAEGEYFKYEKTADLCNVCVAAFCDWWFRCERSLSGKRTA